MRRKIYVRKYDTLVLLFSTSDTSVIVTSVFTNDNFFTWIQGHDEIKYAENNGLETDAYSIQRLA